jgi:hypothetical protein
LIGAGSFLFAGPPQAPKHRVLALVDISGSVGDKSLALARPLLQHLHQSCIGSTAATPSIAAPLWTPRRSRNTRRRHVFRWEAGVLEVLRSPLYSSWTCTTYRWEWIAFALWGVVETALLIATEPSRSTSAGAAQAVRKGKPAIPVAPMDAFHDF